MLAKHLFGTRTSCLHSSGRIGQEEVMWKLSLPSESNALMGHPEILIFLQTFRLVSALWDQRKPLGIIQGRLVGHSSVRTSLADVQLLVKQSCSNLRYFSENVKLENDVSLGQREKI